MSLKLRPRNRVSVIEKVALSEIAKQVIEYVPAVGGASPEQCHMAFYSSSHMETLEDNDFPTGEAWDTTTIRRLGDKVDTLGLIAEFNETALTQTDNDPVADEAVIDESYVVEVVVPQGRPRRLDIDATPETIIDRNGVEVPVYSGAELVLVAA